MHVQDAEALRVVPGGFQGFLEFLFRPHFEAFPGAKKVRETGELPGGNVVEFPIQHGPFGAVPEVIEHDHDRVEAVAGRRG